MTVINPGQWASTTPPGGHDMPRPFHGDRLKALRTERGWSQADFATLDPDDQAALLKVLDALVTKTKLRAITGAG